MLFARRTQNKRIFEMENVKKEKRQLKKRQKDIIFIACWSFFPLLQYLIFYVFVNFNSILMAFQVYERDLINQTGQYVFSLENFSKLSMEFFDLGLLKTCLKNSFTFYFSNLLVGTTLALIFAYYIYKKCFASKFFKIMLFLPSIISSIVLITMFKYFANFVIPELGMRWLGVKIPALTSDPSTKLGAIIFYNIWAGFGTSILLYSGAMANISESVIEAAKIDGASPMREFVKIVIPLVFPTLRTFLITGITAVFISDIGLFSFYGTGADPNLYTFGYYILRGARTATIAEYPYYATVGVVLSFFAIPITLTLRRLLTKFGPSVE